MNRWARQGGMTLIEMIVVVGVSVSILVSFGNAIRIYFEQQGASAAGIRVSQYNSAVAAFINGNLPNVPLGVFDGTAWLQDAATCPGATGAVGYLPCAFENRLELGLAGFQTTITQPNPPFFRAVTNVGAVITDGRPNGGLGGAVVRAAEAWPGLNSLRLVTERMVGMSSYAIDPATAQITAIIDTATPADPWLRRDGSNAMAADLNVGGNDVVNARDLNAGRDVNAANNATAGNNVVGNGVVSNQDIWASRDIASGRNMGATNDVYVGRDVWANHNGTGGDVRIMGSNVPGVGQISLAGALQGGNIVGQGEVVAKPRCPTGGGLQPRIITWAVQMNSNGTASPIGSIQTYADDLTPGNPFGSWRVWLMLHTAADPGGVPPGNARIAYAVACQP